MVGVAHKLPHCGSAAEVQEAAKARGFGGVDVELGAVGGNGKLLSRKPAQVRQRQRRQSEEASGGYSSFSDGLEGEPP